MLLPSLFALAVAAATSSSPLPPDLAAYIEEVRAAGMTGQAQSSLLSVSTVLTGQTALTFPKDPSSGHYGNHYRSKGLDHPPSPEELVQMRSEAAERGRLVTPQLKLLADSDGSGFISSKEGAAFRRVIEFGFKAAHIVASEQPSLDRLCTLMAVSPSELTILAAEYECARVALQGIPTVTMPRLALPTAP